VAVVDDQMGRPTFVDDLVRGTMDAVSRGASGILHLTNIGETTRYGLAQELATMAGHEAARVRPITSEDLGRPARRPANSVLASERLEKLGISALPPFVDAMREVIDGLLLGPGSR
jgi:dTDP-4-dehydrorhamnose reductase